jgi:DNA-binding FadR family transcriptional regulator
VRSEFVVEKIEQWILTKIIVGEFAEEENLPSLERLSQLLQVSRNTLRVAIGKLQSRGLLERVRSEGFKVVDLTRSADLWMLLQIIGRARDPARRKQVAAQLMAVVGRNLKATIGDAASKREEEHIQWLERYVGFLGEAINQRKESPYIGLSEFEFLRTIAGASKNVANTVILNSLRPLFVAEWPRGFGDTPVMSLEDHERLVRFILERDNLRARRFWNDRWFQFSRRWIDAVENLDVSDLRVSLNP